MARLRLEDAGYRQPNAGAYGTFYGSKKHAQFRRWVGVGWAYARRGEGPYVLNETVADELDVIGDLYVQAYMAAFKKVFPEE